MRYTACLMAHLPMWVAAITLRCIRLRWAPPICCMQSARHIPRCVYAQCRVPLWSLWHSLVVCSTDSRERHGGEQPNLLLLIAYLPIMPADADSDAPPITAFRPAGARLLLARVQSCSCKTVRRGLRLWPDRFGMHACLLLATDIVVLVCSLEIVVILLTPLHHERDQKVVYQPPAMFVKYEWPHFSIHSDNKHCIYIYIYIAICAFPEQQESAANQHHCLYYVESSLRFSRLLIDQYYINTYRYIDIHNRLSDNVYTSLPKVCISKTTTNSKCFKIF